MHDAAAHKVCHVSSEKGAPASWNATPSPPTSWHPQRQALLIVFNILGIIKDIKDKRENIRSMGDLMATWFVGVDIGSTATKVAVLDSGLETHKLLLMPTGYSSRETAETVQKQLLDATFDVGSDDTYTVATGYGRIAVPYADETVTEITCHGQGATHLFGPDGTVIDVGGQDTKVISLRRGRVMKFAMNDKCAAGTGRFLEVMANRLGVTQQDMADMARRGADVRISSMCTVFAESEVISLIGRGEARENIAHGVIDSAVGRIAGLAAQGAGEPYFLTGGLCENAYIIEVLAEKLGAPVTSRPEARYAGAIGAAIEAQRRSDTAS